MNQLRQPQPLRNVLYPSFRLLMVVFSLVCLLMVMTGTSDAKGKGGKSFSKKVMKSAKGNKKNFGNKNKHKHRPQVDVDVDSDAPSADAETAEAEGPGEAQEAEQAGPVLYGMEITGLFKGTAAKEGLELGDIILEVNGMPTPTYEALAKALSQSGSQAKVLVIRDDDDDDDERETVTLFPQNGQIGVSVERVRVD